MSRKTQSCYEDVFEFINNKVFNMRERIKLAITDYETAMRNAINVKFVRAELSGCMFHFAQALRRKASKTQTFLNFLRVNDEAHKIYYKFINLALLPCTVIPETFELLSEEANNVSRNNFSGFLKYFRSQWLNKEGARNFSVFGKEIRTTNAAEGYNRVLSDYCKKKAVSYGSLRQSETKNI